MSLSADEVWTAVQAEVSDMARHIGGGDDPMAGFTPEQQTVVRIYAVTAWRLAQQDLADRLAAEVSAGV